MYSNFRGEGCNFYFSKTRFLQKLHHLCFIWLKRGKDNPSTLSYLSGLSNVLLRKVANMLKDNENFHRDFILISSLIL